MYKRRIQQMMDRKERRLMVDLGDMRRFMPSLADKYEFVFSLCCVEYWLL